MQRRAVRVALGWAAALMLVSCAEFRPGAQPDAAALAPEVYDITAEGLWDGRPSLGGVWVAHADVSRPLRVRISRGDAAAVEGALFRRERLLPGPPLQVSSEAAAALGLAAGEPETLRVVAFASEPKEQEPDGEAEADAVEVQRRASGPQPLVVTMPVPTAYFEAD